MPDPISAALPAIAPDASFVPRHEVRGRPHIVVDEILRVSRPANG